MFNAAILTPFTEDKGDLDGDLWLSPVKKNFLR